MGSFQETESRKTAENTVKHRDSGVGLVVANHRGGSESLVVITTLFKSKQHYKILGTFSALADAKDASY